MWVVNETAYNSKPNGITVHFYRPYDWEYWDTRVYFYEDNNILMQWPGTLMNGNREDKWLTYTIYGINLNYSHHCLIIASTPEKHWIK